MKKQLLFILVVGLVLSIAQSASAQACDEAAFDTCVDTSI